MVLSGLHIRQTNCMIEEVAGIPQRTIMVCQVDVNWVMKNISAFLTVSTFVSETKLITGEAGSDILYYGISVYTLYTHAVNE